MWITISLRTGFSLFFPCFVWGGREPTAALEEKARDESFAFRLAVYPIRRADRPHKTSCFYWFLSKPINGVCIICQERKCFHSWHIRYKGSSKNVRLLVDEFTSKRVDETSFSCKILISKTYLSCLLVYLFTCLLKMRVIYSCSR